MSVAIAWEINCCLISLHLTYYIVIQYRFNFEYESGIILHKKYLTYSFSDSTHFFTENIYHHM